MRATFKILVRARADSPKPRKRLPQNLLALSVERTKLLQLFFSHFRVWSQPCPLQTAVSGYVSRVGAALYLRAVPPPFGNEIVVGDAVHLYLNVDTVEKGAGHAGAVAAYVVGQTGALPFAAAVIAAGTGIHARAEHKRGGIGDRPPNG